MTTSNSYNWTLSNADCVLEAFSRCQIRGPEITRSHMSEATRSLNLVLQSEFATRGVNLWQVEEGVVIDLVAPVGQVGTATYVLPSYVLQVLNVRYNMPQENAPGATIDRIMLPIGRDDYAAYPNKLQAGTPTVYWFQRLIPPQLTIWQPDQYGPPNTITYDALRQSQDAYPTLGQTPDAPQRFYEPLVASLAHRLGRKFWSDLVRAKKMTEQAALKMVDDLKAEALQAWQGAALDDQEMAPLVMTPDLSGYFLPR